MLRHQIGTQLWTAAGIDYAALPRTERHGGTGIRTLKEQCVHRHRFGSFQHASRVIAGWIGLYNNHSPHQALWIKTPAEEFALAA